MEEHICFTEWCTTRAVYVVQSQVSEFLHQSQQISWSAVFADNSHNLSVTPSQSNQNSVSMKGQYELDLRLMDEQRQLLKLAQRAHQNLNLPVTHGSKCFIQAALEIAPPNNW